MIAKIYKPAKSSTQSGLARTGEWILEYELETARTPESLMGWTASGDTLNQVRLKFDTLAEAKSFAATEGLIYQITQPHKRQIKPRNYGDNFKYTDVADGK